MQLIMMYIKRNSSIRNTVRNVYSYDDVMMAKRVLLFMGVTRASLQCYFKKGERSTKRHQWSFRNSIFKIFSSK